MPTGSSGIAPSGTIACLRLASSTASSSKLKRLREAAQDLGDLRLHLLVEDQLAAGEAGDHLRRQVVGGRPQAAGGDDQVHSLAGQEAQRRLEVVGPVGDDEDVGDLDPELGQPFGDPGTVGVGRSARSGPRSR